MYTIVHCNLKNHINYFDSYNLNRKHIKENGYNVETVKLFITSSNEQIYLSKHLVSSI